MSHPKGPLHRARLIVQVQPGSRRTELVGWHGEALKVRVAAPPLEGAANSELIQFLAEVLRLPRSNIGIASGRWSRRKEVEIAGIDAGEALKRLGAWMASRGASD